jgi:hypothetical protein
VKPIVTIRRHRLNVCQKVLGIGRMPTSSE